MQKFFHREDLSGEGFINLNDTMYSIFSLALLRICLVADIGPSSMKNGIRSNYMPGCNVGDRTKIIATNKSCGSQYDSARPIADLAGVSRCNSSILLVNRLKTCLLFLSGGIRTPSS